MLSLGFPEYASKLSPEVLQSSVQDVCKATSLNRSSMLQDMTNGMPTEIDAINGYIARLGDRLGVNTPLVTQLYRLNQIQAAGAVEVDIDRMFGFHAL